MFDRLKNILKSELGDLFEKSEDTRTPFQRRPRTHQRDNEYDQFEDIDDAYEKAFNQKTEPILNPEETKHYKTLGLPVGTGFDLIKKKYKQLVKKYHPDRHQANPKNHKIALERTRDLNMAYNYFKDKYEK
jgi:DnaJ-domain-containing protein 1